MDYNNPIIDSVLKIMSAEVQEDCERAFKECKAELGDKLDELMTYLADELFKLYETSDKEKSSILGIALLMTVPFGPDPDDPQAIAEYDPEEEKLQIKYNKALIIWMLENKLI